uniref:RRP12-like protein n=1 Tax=Myxine glutinosa TaxID=7769 RepID=UPI00358EC982
MVRAGRLRSSTKIKLKRWKKGQSSSSNPESNKFRTKARSRFFSAPTGQSNLTEASLKLHDDLEGKPSTCMETEAAAKSVASRVESVTSKGTFLSGLTDCTLDTFGCVQRYWQSNSAAHKEICAVLAAITEVIRSRHGQETETEYFAALMTALETIEKEDSRAAVAFLLNLVIKRVPVPVLKKKMADVVQVFLDIMATATGNSGSSSSLRWIISCLGILLKRQELNVWTELSTLHAFHGLLSFSLDARPKVRKSAQQAVGSVLRGSEFMLGDDAPPHHPAAPNTASFCTKQLEQNRGPGEIRDLLHALGLLRAIISSFPPAGLKACCESLLRLMAVADVLVTSCAMQVLHSLFGARPPSCRLSPQRNAQIIGALYDFLPAESDTQATLAWFAVMERAHTNLSRFTIPVGAETAEKTLEAKIFNTLHLQIWSMLPGFLSAPHDLETAFGALARTLGQALVERQDLQSIICHGLRTAISRCCHEESNRLALARFSKNFIPILFNLWTEDGKADTDLKGHHKDGKDYVLDTIKMYLTITDEQLVGKFMDKALEKMQEEESSRVIRLALMDLVVCMVPYVDETHLAVVYKRVVPCLQSQDHSVQKKAYRALEVMCSGDRPQCHGFLATHFSDLQTVLLSSLSAATSPAKRPRLNCLTYIVKHLSKHEEQFIVTIIPEVILSMKEVGVAARLSASGLLLEMARAYLRFDCDGDGLSRFLPLVYAGLASSVSMISCSILALTSLFFEFKDRIKGESLELLIKMVSLLLKSHTREVVQSALSFVKVAIVILDLATLARHLHFIVDSFVSWSEQTRRHFRTAVRHVLIRLVRKFGFDMIHGFLSEPYHKVLQNIRKSEERRRCLRANRKAEAEHPGNDKRDMGNSIEEVLAESDEEEEGEEQDESTKKGRKALRLDAWLKEGGQDDPLDFLDPVVSRRVLATKPVKMSATLQHDFKMTPDGRLIICNEEEEEKLEKSKSVKGSGKVKNDLEELMAEVGGKNTRKRKLTRGEEEIELEDEDIVPKYRAGGSGIHRSLEPKKEELPGLEYRAKKAFGDVKKKGKPDPYAYIPFNKARLNRRKKAKMQGQFKGLVHAARKGAQKGTKQRKKKLR